MYDRAVGRVVICVNHLLVPREYVFRPALVLGGKELHAWQDLQKT